MSHYNQAVECLAHSIKSRLSPSAHPLQSYYPLVCGSARGKKYQLVHQSIRLALKDHNIPSTLGNTKVWLNTLTPDMYLDYKVSVVDIPYSGASFESLDFVQQLHKGHKDMRDSSVIYRLVTSLLQHVQQVGLGDSTLEQDIYNRFHYWMEGLESSIMPVSPVKSVKVVQVVQDVRHVSPWEVTGLKHIEMEYYNTQMTIPCSSTDNKHRCISSQGIKLKYQTSPVQPSTTSTDHVHIIQTAGQQLANIMMDILPTSSNHTCFIIMDFIHWIHAFASRDVETIKREKSNIPTRQWMDLEWDIYRYMLNRLLDTRSSRYYFIFTTIPTPKDVMDPDFYFHQQDQDHPFLQAYLNPSHSSLLNEPIETDLYYWRPCTTSTITCPSFLHMSALPLPPSIKTLNHEQEAQDHVLVKMEELSKKIPVQETVKTGTLEILYQQTLPTLIDALKQEKYSQVVELLTCLQTADGLIQSLIAYPLFPSLLHLLRQRFMACPLDSEMAMEYSTAQSPKQTTRLVASRKACYSLATLLSHIASYAQTQSHYTSQTQDIIKKCIHLIHEGNIQEKIAGGTLLLNSQSSRTCKVLQAARHLVLQADYLKCMENTVNDAFRYQLYQTSTRLLQSAQSQSTTADIKELHDTAQVFAGCLYHALVFLLKQKTTVAHIELDTIVTQMMDLSCQILFQPTFPLRHSTPSLIQKGLVRTCVYISTQGTLECSKRALYWLRKVNSHAIVDKQPHIATIQQLWAATHPQQRKCSVDWERFIFAP